jgi:hypothetical protein
VKFDRRLTLALVFAVFVEAAGGFVRAGQASARLANVEQRVQASPEVAERLARLEEQISEARRALARIERRLDGE